MDAPRQSTLLLVEDDATTLEQFRLILLSEGYAILPASDLSSALAHIETGAPDAVLLDLHLPPTDGLACLRALRASDRHLHVPVAVITGDYFLDDAISREIEAGNARVCFKPIWADELVLLARDLLDESIE